MIGGKSGECMHGKASEVTVRPADGGRAFAQFLDLPYRLHADNPHWVPPLRAQQRATVDPDRNPFYAHARQRLFLAFRDGVPLGRIAAINNSVHCETHGEACTHFGFFECIDDARVAAALFGAVEDAARDWGHDLVRGPFSPSVSAEIGIQIDAFDTPSYVMIPNNPAYYQGLVEGLGYEKDIDLYCYMIRKEDVSERLLRGAERIAARSRLTFRKLEKRHVDAEALRIWQVYNAAWEKNWLWTHASREEFLHLVADLKQIADFDLIWLAENAAGELIGFSVAVPNVNEAVIRLRDGRLFPFGLLRLLWHTRPGAIRSVRFLVMGVLEAYRGQGVDTVLNYHQFIEGVRKGYTHGEMSQILEDNTMMIRAAEGLGGVRYKTHRMYVKGVGR